jgi:hypothetical protein
MERLMFKYKLLVIISIMVVVTGCSNRLESHTSADFVGKQTPVDRIAVGGQGASIAVPAFDRHGYKVVDLGSGNLIEKAIAQKVRFIATVDPVDSNGAWWDGYFVFSMRVTETIKRLIVWSAQADYGQSGIFIDQATTTKEAMADMVDDFAKHFPPTK